MLVRVHNKCTYKCCNNIDLTMTLDIQKTGAGTDGHVTDRQTDRRINLLTDKLSDQQTV